MRDEGGIFISRTENNAHLWKSVAIYSGSRCGIQVSLFQVLQSHLSDSTALCNDLWRRRLNHRPNDDVENALCSAASPVRAPTQRRPARCCPPGHAPAEVPRLPCTICWGLAATALERVTAGHVQGTARRAQAKVICLTGIPSGLSEK